MHSALLAPTLKSRARLLSGAAVMLLAIPQAAAAQETIALDQVVVTSASGKATSVQDAPASITVIGAEEIAASGARDLQDVLRTVPGLNLTNGNDGGKSVSFRGMSSSRTLTLVDGRRLGSRNTMPRDYQGDLGVVPVDAIERIEVVRGPMSTLYGSDAMGGVINIITKKGSEVWSGSVTADFTAGDSSTTASSDSLSGFVTGPLGKDLTLSAWAKNANIDSPTADIDGRVANKGSETRTLGLRLNWAATDASTFGLEVGTTLQDYLATEAAGAGTSREVTRDHLALTHELSFGTGQLDSALRFENSKNTPVSTTGASIDYKTINLESRYTDLTSIGGKDLDYTLGVSISQEELNDPLTTTGKLISGKADTAAIYAEGRLRFSDALTVTGGLRVDHHDKFGTHATPRLYANYDFGNGMMLKAGYAQAFVAPDLRNLSSNYQLGSNGNGCKPYQGPCTIFGNPDLKPETSDNFELGLNYQGSDLNWEVTGFYNEVDNMIGARRTDEILEYVNVRGTLKPRYKFVRSNFDEGRTAGIEAGFNWQATNDLTWSGTATYIAISEFKYGNSDTKYPMATTPEWNLSTSLAYQLNDKTKLHGTVNYVGKQANFVTENDVILTDGAAPSVPAGQNSKDYFLVNVGASFNLTETASLNLGVDNLFNEQTSSDVSYSENGRLFRVGLTTRF